MFSIPSAVHWMARRYGTPFLQIVLNNNNRMTHIYKRVDGFEQLENIMKMQTRRRFVKDEQDVPLR